MRFRRILDNHQSIYTSQAIIALCKASLTRNIRVTSLAFARVMRNDQIAIIANEAADPRGSAVELANHRAVREYRRKISSQRKGPFF